MQRYNPKDIESKWQKTWEDSGIYQATEDPSKPKKYILEYFPYPSGAAMHVGHVRNYTIGDVLARFNRMAGYNVLHPMGWDGFGLPAENYAIKTGISPRQAIDQNTARFKEQLTQMGFSYDWSREIDSTDPKYYKWTQWFFLLLQKRGLAYQQESLQWWCPFDKTVLANEQVEAGRCWRCGNEVEKKALKQWFFRITDYADRLAKDLDDVDWSDSIKAMQRNWIGRSTGAEVDFPVASDDNYILLHGFTGSSKNDFFPWLQGLLEKDSRKVFVPDLPNTEKPDAKEQAAYVLAAADFDENSVLLGHSYGGVTALRILEQLDRPIKRLVLAAAFAQPGFLDTERNFEATTDWNFDFAKIKKNARDIVILRDTNDPAVPAERADYLRDLLGARVVDFEAEEGHITGRREPVVYATIREQIRVFTTRPDTLYGATFMVLSPEHPLVETITTAEHKQKVNTYRKAAQAKSDIERQETNREKTGVFTGAYAINPATGAKIPVWIADYVLMGYGTGAIMAVPAHDERDHAFAEKFKLPIVEVVAPEFGAPLPNAVDVTGPVVIGYDPKTKKFMSLINTKNDMRWFASGGLEEGETYEQAALRELAEEAGFRNVKKLISLGGPTYSYYFNSNKNSNRRSFSYMFLAVIDAAEASSQALEAHESYAVEWSSAADILHDLEKEPDGRGHWIDGMARAEKAAAAYDKGDEYVGPMFSGEGVLFNSGPYDGLSTSEARERIVADLSGRAHEPIFVASTGESAIKPGEEFIKREAVVAIVRNPETGAYLCTSWKTHAMNGLVTGGVEAGEDPVEAAKREIYEETGYKNVRFVSDPDIYINSLFYHRQKKQNRWAHFHFIFFELENEERDPVDEAEAALQEIVWKNKSELQDFFSVVEGKFIVDLLDNPEAAHQGSTNSAGAVSHDDLVQYGIPGPVVTELTQPGVARERVNYKMRDWLISRQRYWGAPIPMIHCEKCGTVPVPEDQLPVTLPELDKFEPSGDGRSPLANVPDWVNTTCPSCDGPAQRETDTMDGFACSSWYFLRFADPHNDEKPFDDDKVKFWLPVDDYIGGAEHAVMHLLYARMWTKVMQDAGLIDFGEPFRTLRNQGMILAPDGAKMSKSKGNTIEPGVLIDQGYGADAIRIMELFIGPWNQAANWSVEGMGGAYRFLQRIWTLVQEYQAADKGTADSAELLRVVHKAIKKVGEDVETMNFNTAIASLMELTNELYRLKAADKYAAEAWGESLGTVVQLLAPFAPHIAEELWHQLGHEESVHASSWPAFDDAYLAEDTVTIVIQVNGKLRGELKLPTDADETQVVAAARTDEKIAGYLEGKTLRKTIYVPGRLVNFVV